MLRVLVHLKTRPISTNSQPTGSKLGQSRAPDWDDTQTTHIHRAVNERGL